MPLEAEFLARHRDHAYFLEQEMGELLRILHVCAEIREAVKGAVRLVNFDAVESFQAVHHHVPVILQRDPQALDRRLHTVERAHGCPLRWGSRPGGLLRLDGRHGLDQRFISDRPTDAEAGHGIHLGYPVDHHQLRLLERRLHEVVGDGRVLAVEH